MKKIDNNVVKTADISIDASSFIPEVAAVRGVRIQYGKDTNGKKDDDSIEAVRYDCVNMENLSTFTIKVEGKKPVVMQETVEDAEQPLYIAIPVSDVVIKVYDVSYGRAKVSIISPYVSLITD